MESFSVQLSQALNECKEEIVELANTDLKQAATETRNMLKRTSPKRPKHGEYARSWTVKVDPGMPKLYTVHNKKHYQLTHLLENGHVTISHGKTGRRTPAHPHIKDAEQFGIKRLTELLAKERL